jgi:hypothetical protein
MAPKYAELGHGLDPEAPVRPYPPLHLPEPNVRPIAHAVGPVLYSLGPPLRCARWRWSGHPDLFDILDGDDDEAVDEEELARGLGRGVALLRGETADPLSIEAWDGSHDAFRLLDTDGDGRVSREEIARGLGPHAVLLAHGHPAHGPLLPEGTAYGWTATGRWAYFPDRDAKAAYMRAAAHHDALSPEVRSWAREFTPLSPEERAAAILRFCQEDIRYERDPATFDPDGTRHGIELLDSAPVGLFRAYGDCDLKARLFVALCLASGLVAEIDPVFRGAYGFPHVRAKVLRGTGETSGAPQQWDVADPTIVNSTIGHLPDHPLTSWN